MVPLEASKVGELTERVQEVEGRDLVAHFGQSRDFAKKTSGRHFQSSEEFCRFGRYLVRDWRGGALSRTKTTRHPPFTVKILLD